jgi:hypothetical protein
LRITRKPWPEEVFIEVVEEEPPAEPTPAA